MGTYALMTFKWVENLFNNFFDLQGQPYFECDIEYQVKVPAHEKVSKKKLIMEMHLFPGKILVCGPKLRCWIQTVPTTIWPMEFFSAKIQSLIFPAIFTFFLNIFVFFPLRAKSWKKSLEKKSMKFLKKSLEKIPRNSHKNPLKNPLKNSMKKSPNKIPRPFGPRC